MPRGGDQLRMSDVDMAGSWMSLMMGNGNRMDRLHVESQSGACSRAVRLGLHSATQDWKAHTTCRHAYWSPPIDSHPPRLQRASDPIFSLGLWRKRRCLLGCECSEGSRNSLRLVA